MQHAERGDREDQPVQPLPARPERPDPAIGRGPAQRRQPQQRDEADGQVDPQHDLGGDLPQAEILVARIEHQVQHRIGQRHQAEQPAQRQDARLRQDLPDRRHRQGQQQQPDGPEADLLQRRLPGLRPQQAERGLRRATQAAGASSRAKTTARSVESRPARSCQGQVKGRARPAGSGKAVRRMACIMPVISSRPAASVTPRSLTAQPRARISAATRAASSSFGAVEGRRRRRQHLRLAGGDQRAMQPQVPRAEPARIGDEDRHRGRQRLRQHRDAVAGDHHRIGPGEEAGIGVRPGIAPAVQPVRHAGQRARPAPRSPPRRCGGWRWPARCRRSPRPRRRAPRRAPGSIPSARTGPPTSRAIRGAGSAASAAHSCRAASSRAWLIRWQAPRMGRMFAASRGRSCRPSTSRSKSAGAEARPHAMHQRRPAPAEPARHRRRAPPGREHQPRPGRPEAGAGRGRQAGQARPGPGQPGHAAPGQRHACGTARPAARRCPAPGPRCRRADRPAPRSAAASVMDAAPREGYETATRRRQGYAPWPCNTLPTGTGTPR